MSDENIDLAQELKMLIEEVLVLEKVFAKKAE